MAPIGTSAQLESLATLVHGCRACPRLVAWREHIGREKRAAFAGEDYWAAPITGMGDPEARLLILGLAPAAHGGNRTGRIFTGDRSGDWLFASLYRCGFANQPTSIHRHDGLRLTDAYVTAAVRCAPPGNKPLPQERDRCRTYLIQELDILQSVGVIVALGAFAWDAALRTLAERGEGIPKPKPRFGHLAEIVLGDHLLLGSFHPSQQNTFTGKLTEEMLDAVFLRARSLVEKSV
jgi:uracil-DNA glycosylase